MKKINAWHFVNEQRTLRYAASRLTVEPGYVYSELRGALHLCNRGMHASIDPFDALTYAPGPWLCKVQCWGDVIHGSDKLVCRHREVVEMRDVSKMLRLFACWCVRKTPLADGRKVWNLLTDTRSKRVVRVAEAYALGLCSLDELVAANNDAIAAMRAVKTGAKLDAARAATGTARTAVAAAARFTTGDTWAASTTTTGALYSPAINAQRKHFNKMVKQEFSK